MASSAVPSTDEAFWHPLGDDGLEGSGVSDDDGPRLKRARLRRALQKPQRTWFRRREREKASSEESGAASDGSSRRDERKASASAKSKAFTSQEEDARSGEPRESAKGEAFCSRDSKVAGKRNRKETDDKHSSFAAGACGAKLRNAEGVPRSRLESAYPDLHLDRKNARWQRRASGAADAPWPREGRATGDCGEGVDVREPEAEACFEPADDDATSLLSTSESEDDPEDVVSDPTTRLARIFKFRYRSLFQSREIATRYATDADTSVLRDAAVAANLRKIEVVNPRNRERTWTDLAVWNALRLEIDTVVALRRLDRLASSLDVEGTANDILGIARFSHHYDATALLRHTEEAWEEYRHYVKTHRHRLASEGDAVDHGARALERMGELSSAYFPNWLAEDASVFILEALLRKSAFVEEVRTMFSKNPYRLGTHLGICDRNYRKLAARLGLRFEPELREAEVIIIEHGGSGRGSLNEDGYQQRLHGALLQRGVAFIGEREGRYGACVATLKAAGKKLYTTRPVPGLATTKPRIHEPIAPLRNWPLLAVLPRKLRGAQVLPPGHPLLDVALECAKLSTPEFTGTVLAVKQAWKDGVCCKGVILYRLQQPWGGSLREADGGGRADPWHRILKHELEARHGIGLFYVRCTETEDLLNEYLDTMRMPFTTMNPGDASTRGRALKNQRLRADGKPEVNLREDGTPMGDSHFSTDGTLGGVKVKEIADRLVTSWERTDTFLRSPFFCTTAARLGLPQCLCATQDDYDEGSRILANPSRKASCAECWHFPHSITPGQRNHLGWLCRWSSAAPPASVGEMWKSFRGACAERPRPRSLHMVREGDTFSVDAQGTTVMVFDDPDISHPMMRTHLPRVHLFPLKDPESGATRAAPIRLHSIDMEDWIIAAEAVTKMVRACKGRVLRLWLVGPVAERLPVDERIEVWRDRGLRKLMELREGDPLFYIARGALTLQREPKAGLAETPPDAAGVDIDLTVQNSTDKIALAAAVESVVDLEDKFTTSRFNLRYQSGAEVSLKSLLVQLITPGKKQTGAGVKSALRAFEDIRARAIAYWASALALERRLPTAMEVRFNEIDEVEALLGAMSEMRAGVEEREGGRGRSLFRVQHPFQEASVPPSKTVVTFLREYHSGAHVVADDTMAHGAIPCFHRNADFAPRHCLSPENLEYIARTHGDAMVNYRASPLLYALVRHKATMARLRPPRDVVAA
jgi:hypothetical protein